MKKKPVADTKKPIKLPGGAIFQLQRTSKLVPYARNPRKNDGAVSPVAKSIEEFGFRSPIEVDGDGKIVAGHTRLKAAIERGDEFVPVITWPDLHGHKSNAYRIASNKTGELADWDEALLSELLVEILESNESIDLDAIGFDDKELKELLRGPAEPPQIEESPVPESPKKPKTKLGDLWVLGEHRVLCGDVATECSALFSQPYDLLVTDPPYGVSYGKKNEFLNAVGKGNRIQDEIAGDNHSSEEMGALWTTWFTAIRKHARPGSSYYITGPQGGDLLFLFLALQHSNFPLRHMLVWAKHNHVLGRSDYNYKHEPIMYGWVDGASHNFYGDPSETSLWEIRRPQKADLHPTMKPVELCARAICNSSKMGEIVADPFLGSGTTLIAAEQLNRRCFGMEIEPAYCDVIVQRWENLTGEKARKEK